MQFYNQIHKIFTALSNKKNIKSMPNNTITV